MLKSINPEAYITAEIVDEPNKMKSYLEGDEFDALMNYNFLFICSEYFFDEKTRIKTSEFDNRLKILREAFPECVTYAQMNLNGSHDTQRQTSHLVNKDLAKIKNWGETFDIWKGANHKYKLRKPTKEEYDIIKLLSIFQMTYVGAPYIYYGDEAGMWGANDPCCRKPMVWDDMQYEDEIFLPDQTLKNKPEKVEFNKELYEHIKKLIHIRNSNEALQLGDFNTLLVDDKNEIFIFSRSYKDQKIIICINNSLKDFSTEIKTDHKGDINDLLNNEKIKPEKGKVSFNIKQKWGRILLQV